MANINGESLFHGSSSFGRIRHTSVYSMFCPRNHSVFGTSHSLAIHAECKMCVYDLPIWTLTSMWRFSQWLLYSLSKWHRMCMCQPPKYNCRTSNNYYNISSVYFGQTTQARRLFQSMIRNIPKYLFSYCIIYQTPSDPLVTMNSPLCVSLWFKCLNDLLFTRALRSTILRPTPGIAIFPVPSTFELYLSR